MVTRNYAVRGEAPPPLPLPHSEEPQPQPQGRREERTLPLTRGPPQPRAPPAPTPLVLSADLTPRSSAARIAEELVRHGRFQYLGDRPLEVTDSLKGYRRSVAPSAATSIRGSSTDAIYRAEPATAASWWRPGRPRGWRPLAWAGLGAALLLLLGVTLYFLLTDLQTASPASGQPDWGWDGTKQQQGGGASPAAAPETEPPPSPTAAPPEPTQPATDEPAAYDAEEEEAEAETQADAGYGTETDDDSASDFLVAATSLLGKLKGTTHSPLLPKPGRKPARGKQQEQAAPRIPVAPTVPPATLRPRRPSPPIPTQPKLNDSEGLCFSPRLVMCRGVLPYDLTTLPLVPGVRRLPDLDAALPYFEMILESGCSPRARQFVCSLLEPACQPAGDNLVLPCRTACKAVAEDCSDFILSTLDLSRVFECDRYPEAGGDAQCVNFARGASCLRGEFRCPDGTCVPGRWVCDGVRDCVGAHDEYNCTACSDDEFRCEEDRKCVPARWRCDGQRDCADGSDEADCPAREGCGEGQFQCADRSACLPQRWLCDGLTHCPDASDERNCSGVQCHAGDFQCRKTGQCIPTLWRCNGVNDCADNSDEDHCTAIRTPPRLTAMPHTSPCPVGELRCLDGRCITLQQLCDRRQDCSDGADEANCGAGV